MTIDFEQDYGVNAGYVEALYAEWEDDPNRVEETWRKLFERADKPPRGPAKPSPASEEAHRAIRLEMTDAVVRIARRCPDSRERDQFLLLAQQAQMMANAAIAIHGVRGADE